MSGHAYLSLRRDDLVLYMIQDQGVAMIYLTLNLLDFFSVDGK